MMNVFTLVDAAIIIGVGVVFVWLSGLLGAQTLQSDRYRDEAYKSLNGIL